MMTQDDRVTEIGKHVASLSERCIFLMYRHTLDDGDVVLREHSFFSTDEAMAFVKDNGLEGYLFHVESPNRNSKWTLIGPTDESMVMSERESRQIENITYRSRMPDV